MMRLVLADIRMQVRMWSWGLLAAAVGAACSAGSVIAMFTAMSAAGAVGDSDMVSASIALGGNIVFFTVLSTTGIVASIAGLTLTAQQREHALWLILGIPRRRVRTILRVELLALGLAAGIIAIPFALLAANISLTQWATTGLNLHGATATFEPWHAGAAVLSGTVPCILGGWGVTSRIAKMPEMRAFREAANPAARLGVGRIVLAFCLFAGVVGMWIPGLLLDLDGGLPQRTAFVFAGNLFLICLLLLMGPWVLTPLMRGWTSLVPARGVAWHLAVQACRTRAARSVTTILPFALTMSFVGLFMVMGNVMPGSSAGIDDVLVVLGWVFVVAWVGGLAVIALVGTERRRDSALITVAGARPGMVSRSTMYEGVIYAGTAIVFGAITFAIAAVTISMAAKISLAEMVPGIPWATLGGLALVTLITPVLALAAQAYAASRSHLTRVLRS
ncbi:FtsX-like permease family protein [Rhodococcus kronopolitis]|uniref:FtsX-like permease family protein n=1 Tax=Rhodococcus kronopolitis TaxID=1460226 RepID=A0ABV9FTL2_9NOCA